MKLCSVDHDNLNYPHTPNMPCGKINIIMNDNCMELVLIFAIWREISVKIMVYYLNLVMAYTLHSGGAEISFWVDTDSTLVWTPIPLWCGH